MQITKEVRVYGRFYPVTVSDEKEALQAAYAAGGAVVGLWERGGELKAENAEAAGAVAGIPPDGGCMDTPIPDLSPALYIAGSLSDIGEDLLKKAVCRRFHIPWEIAVTKRLLIREFRAADPLPAEEEEFKTPELLSSYIACQYRFHECGLWALVERSSGRLIGKAGITDAAERELGYHIYTPYRRRGFAEEACRAILAWAGREGFPDVSLRIKKGNTASIALAEKLGFLPESEARQPEPPRDESPWEKPPRALRPGTSRTGESMAEKEGRTLSFRIKL